MIIVLDTNVLVSGIFWTGNEAKIIEGCKRGDYTNIASPYTLEELEKPIHKPVNPTLCSLMYDVGFIEKYGSGIYMMKELCKKWENEEPHYELHPLETRIHFTSPVTEPTLVDIKDISAKLNERQKRALELALRKGLITRKEYMEIGKVSHTIAHKELRRMVEIGLLTPKGKGRSLVYLLIEKVDD